MTGLVRKATLLLSVCGLLAASSAFASVPDPGNSTFTRTTLNLVGHDLSAGDPNPLGAFSVHVEDLAGNPIQGSIVVVDFSACSDIKFCEDQFGNSTANCATHTVRKTTDVNGDVTFNIVGAAVVDLGDPDGSNCDCVEIYADGVNIVELADQPVNAGTFDFDNSDGIGGADLTLWVDDWSGGFNPPRADYDHDPFDDCTILGGVGGADLTLWVDIWSAGLSPYSCGQAPHVANKCTP